MVRTYRLVVKRLPRKVCVSIRAAKGRSLLKKRKYVRKRKRAGRKRKRGKRRKMKWTGRNGYFSKCMKKHKNYKGKYKAKMCGRRYRRGLKP